VPIAVAYVNGEEWSWCRSKLGRIRFKRSIADAAVDGIVPEGHLRSPEQAFDDLMGWLDRLETEGEQVITRPYIPTVPLPDTDKADVSRRQHRYGDFSRMNNRWNQSNSQKTHERLTKNAEEWEQYHTLYREARDKWEVMPYKEMTNWCSDREGYRIGDFGCGEAKLAVALREQHTVFSFDHVAINENVTACDMVDVPLESGTLDVAIFSLSLMGENFSDYLREAHRCLKLDGHLHIIESAIRFSNIAAFVEGLKALGFDVVQEQTLWKFTHIHALKSKSTAAPNVRLSF